MYMKFCFRWGLWPILHAYLISVKAFVKSVQIMSLSASIVMKLRVYNSQGFADVCICVSLHLCVHIHGAIDVR